MDKQNLIWKGGVKVQILNNDEKYEAYMELLQSRLDRSLSEHEQNNLRWLADSETENFHVFRNLFEELGSRRVDN
jgi:hypothetical protein